MIQRIPTTSRCRILVAAWPVIAFIAVIIGMIAGLVAGA